MKFQNSKNEEKILKPFGIRILWALYLLSGIMDTGRQCINVFKIQSQNILNLDFYTQPNNQLSARNRAFLDT